MWAPAVGRPQTHAPPSATCQYHADIQAPQALPLSDPQEGHRPAQPAALAEPRCPNSSRYRPPERGQRFLQREELPPPRAWRPGWPPLRCLSVCPLCACHKLTQQSRQLQKQHLFTGGESWSPTALGGDWSPHSGLCCSRGALGHRRDRLLPARPPTLSSPQPAHDALLCPPPQQAPWTDPQPPASIRRADFGDIQIARQVAEVPV